MIVNVGGKETNAGLVGFDAAAGKTKWTATNHGASYATPTVAAVHGQPHLLALTEAGFVDLDPRDGKVRWEVPFRSNIHESVNATAPLVAGDLVLVTATYRTGALCLRIKPQGPPEEVWRNKFPDSHFSNLILADGKVFGFAGRHEPDAELFAMELATGKIGCRGTPRWAGDN